MAQPIQPSGGSSIERAVGSTTSQTTGKTYVSEAAVPGPECVVGADRAIGRAEVKPSAAGGAVDLSRVEQRLNAVGEADANVAAKSAAAQAALQEAGRLQAEAQRDAALAAQRRREAQLEIERTSAAATAANEELRRAKEAESVRNKAMAEMAAKSASQAKAEQTAAIEAVSHTW